MSMYNSWENIEEVAKRLDKGGVLDPPYLLRMRHRMSAKNRIAQLKEVEQNTSGQQEFMMPGPDDIAAAHICRKSTSELTECTISELLATCKGSPAIGRFIRLTTNEAAFRMSAIQCCAEDSRGFVITVSLYNIARMYASVSEVAAFIPIGTQMVIKEPYLKCSNYGNIAVRVDNPSNVTLVQPTVAKSIAAAVNLNADTLKAEGNAHFKSGDYSAAVQCYTAGLPAAQSLQVALLSNRAACHLHLCAFHSALQDCEAVLGLDPGHVKATARKEEAVLGLERAKGQRNGLFDYLTMPFTPALQSGMENYYGPVEIRSAGEKGRGMFVTKDVQIGELLFAEKAFAFKEESDKENTMGVNYSNSSGGTGMVSKGSTVQLNWEMTMLVNADPSANAQLALLAHDLLTPNAFIPSMDTFRNQSFDVVPVLSAKRVTDATNVNSFHFCFKKEPSAAERRDLAASLRPGVPPMEFISGVSKQSTATRGKQSSKLKDGSAVWIFGSFMNHSADMTGSRRFLGKMMFVHALRPLKAGDEVTTSYSKDREELKKWGIFS
jgi:hypothetical protein